MSLRAAANSSGVIDAKSFSRSTSWALCPMESGSPSAGAASRPICGSRRMRRALLCIVRGSTSRGGATRPARRRNHTSNARSNVARSSRRATNVVRSAQ